MSFVDLTAYSYLYRYSNHPYLYSVPDLYLLWVRQPNLSQCHTRNIFDPFVFYFPSLSNTAPVHRLLPLTVHQQKRIVTAFPIPYHLHPCFPSANIAFVAFTTLRKT
jgi:hypothetical protein